MYQYPLQVELFQRWRGTVKAVEPVIDRYEFLVRTITRREYQNWRLSAADDTAFEELLLKSAVLRHPDEYRGAPWDWDLVPAGIPDRVIGEILLLSGFSQAPHPLIMEQVQEYTSGEDAKYDMLILTATDAYKLDELLDLHPADYHKLVALARWKLQLIGFDEEMILDPDGYLKKMKAAQRIAAAQAQVAQTAGSRTRGRNVSVIPEAEMSVVAGGQVNVPRAMLQG